MKKTKLAFLIFIATGIALSASTRSAYAQTTPTPTPTPAGKTILVDDDRRQFRNAPFSYINNAIFSAKAGDTIRVAPGIYREAVVINKAVRVIGAQSGQAATGRNRLSRFSPEQESILEFGQNLLELNPIDDAIVTVKSGAGTAALDGFTIRGDGTSQFRIGVAFDGAVSGFSLLNTRIENTTIGVVTGDPKNDEASGSLTDVRIEDNAFLDNQNLADPNFPKLTGRGISAATATNVSILSNLFAGNQDVALLLGKPDVPPPGNQALADEEVNVSNVTVSSNLFDASLSDKPSGANLVLLNATSVTLTKNIVRGGTTVGIQLDAQDGVQTTQPAVISQNNISGVAGNGMFFSNSLRSASITRNTVSGNSGNGIVVSEVATFVNAFNVFSRNKVFGNASGFLLFNAIGNNLDNNTVTGNGNGIIVDRSQDNFFRNNVIRDSSVDGISVNEFGSGNVFSRNRIQTSGRFDINDLSIGDETYGTLNIYRGNKAAVTNPPGLGTPTK